MKRTLTIAILVTILATSAAFAQGRGPGPGAPPPPAPNAGPGDLLADYLGLTAEQRAAWEAARQAARPELEALHQEKRAIMEQLRTALQGTDPCAIGDLMLAQKEVDAEIRAANEALHEELLSVLTAEQKTKFEAFQAALAFLQQQGPNRGPGPGPGN